MQTEGKTFHWCLTFEFAYFKTILQIEEYLGFRKTIKYCGKNN